MNCNVVSERRKWLEIECSLMICTTLTNASATSTNTITDRESTGRRESQELWKRHICHWRGIGTVLFLLRKGICMLSVIKWGFFGICYPRTLFYSRCYFYSFRSTMNSGSISPTVLGLDLPLVHCRLAMLIAFKKEKGCLGGSIG